MSLLLTLGLGVPLFAALMGTAIVRSVTAVVRERVPQIGMSWTVVDGARPAPPGPSTPSWRPDQIA